MAKKIKDSESSNLITPLGAKERATFILNRATKMWEAKQWYSRRWEEYEKQWKFFEELRQPEDQWRANLPDTWAFATVKTAQAAFADSKVVPLFRRHEDEDRMKAVDLRDLYIDNADKGNLEQELYYARLDSFKLGMGFLETTYIDDKRDIHEIDNFNPETKTFTYKKKEIKEFDDPKSIRTSPWMMLIDEMAKADFNTARDCVKIEVLDYDTAKRKYGHYIGGDSAWEARVKKAGSIKQFLEAAAKSHVGQTAATNTGDQRDLGTFRFYAPIELADDAIEILHYWNKGITTPSGTQDSYEIIANGEPVKVDTKKDPSPIPYIHKQLPFTPIPYSPYSGDEFWAAGILEIGNADVRSIRKNREMMSDRQKISLFSPAFSDVNDEIDQKILKLRPLSIIRTKGGVPKQFQIPGVSNADLSLLDRDEQSYKRAVGIDERILGVSPEGVRLTATEVSFLREAALRRLREFASFLYKNALLREVQLKMKLFQQYYSSPLKQEEHLTNDKGLKELKVKARQFKVKVDSNVYVKRDINAHILEGEVDVDLDMRVLVPMTQSQMVAKWAQVLRDITPFAANGISDIDINKIIKEYLDALEVNVETLKKDVVGDSIQVAEAEHRLFADNNNSDKMLQVLPEGTPEMFLTADHLQRHKELLETDDNIRDQERVNLIKHIAKDRENFMKMQQQQANMAPLANNQNVAQIGLAGGQQQAPQLPPFPQMQKMQSAEAGI